MNHAMDFEDKYDIQQRQNETKAERRERRKRELDFALRQLHSDDKMYGIYSEPCKHPYGLETPKRVKKVTYLDRHSEDIMKLVGKARQGKYSDADIGEMFRELISKF